MTIEKSYIIMKTLSRKMHISIIKLETETENNQNSSNKYYYLLLLLLC